MKNVIPAVTAALLVTASNQALSIPVKFTYSSAVAASSFGVTSGVSNGDILTLDIIADNGHAGINSEFWDLENILSAQIKVGSYVANFNYPYWKANHYSHFIWTNSAGEVIASSWGDIDNNNTDNLGGSLSPEVFNNAIYTSLGTRLNFQDYYINDSRAWTVSNVSVSEPASLALLGVWLLGLGLAWRNQS